MSSLGYKHSEGAKEKIRDAMTGRKVSEEAKRNISKAKTGKSNPCMLGNEIWRLSSGMTGKTHSIESRRKMSESGRGKHSGSASGSWKGGISKVRGYSAWKES